MSSVNIIEKFKKLPDLERKNIMVSAVFTVTLHLIVIILLSSFDKEEKGVYKKPNFIKAKILIKGVKDGQNSYNAKTDKIRTKKKKYLPDKITKKVKRRRSNATTVTDVAPQHRPETRSADKNTVALGKKKDIRAKGKSKVRPSDKNKKNKKKTEKELTDAERSRLLLSSLKKVNPALPDDRKGDKNGDLGKRKGGKNGVENGNETDPSKVLAGSLYERRVATKIKSKWKTPVLNDNLKKKLLYRIRIYINKDGSFTYKTLKRSGNVFFDDSVVNVLKRITKVEAPSPEFAKYYKEKGIVINFFPKI